MYLVVFELLTGGEPFDRIAAKRKFNEKEASAVIREVRANRTTARSLAFGSLS